MSEIQEMPGVAERLLPVKGEVSVWLGDRRIASSTNAFKTAEVEAAGAILIPIGDVLDLAASNGGAPAVQRSNRSDPVHGEFVSFDTAQVRILVDDRWGDPEGGGTIARFPRWGDMHDLLRLMDVQPAGEGRFVAPSYGDVRRNVVEGGQLLGGAIIAAARTVPGQNVVSAHIVLSRPAIFDKTLDLEVAPHRLGRSFSTLGIETTQGGKPISSSLILLDRGAPDLIRGQITMPDVPGPEESKPFDFGVVGRDSRFVNGDYDQDPDHVGPAELNCWVRHRDSPGELCLRQALFVQSMSHFTIAAAMLPHKGYGEVLAHHSLSTGVLTVTVAFHDDPDISQWHLYSNPAIHAGRGLAHGEGNVFAQDGRLIASYTAQVMIRNYDQPADAIGLDSTRIM